MSAMRILIVTLAAAGMIAQAQNDWRTYGGTDPGGSVENRRYSTLKQIDTGNVTKLVQGWTYSARPADAKGAARASQVTPLVVNGVMYLVTSYQSLVAMEPETGKQSSGPSRTPTPAVLRAASRTGRARGRTAGDFVRHRSTDF